MEKKGKWNSCSLESGWEYEVFLSFRGEDTRRTFTDHLYNSLMDRGIHTFRDNEKLELGQKIGPGLFSAIQQSKIAIPVISQSYVSSKWCLHELAEIIQCMKQRGQIVLPLFYHVDPSAIRNASTSYRRTFRKHNKEFDYQTVEGWKMALREVGELKGWEASKTADGYEGKLVQIIVQKVWSELRNGLGLLTVSNNLVGIHSHVEKMIKMLKMGSDDVQIVGIHGFVGIGKTEISRCVYNAVYHKFDGCCFILNTQDIFERSGAVYVQNQILKTILNIENPNITSIDDGMKMIGRRLSNKKVLIVLDDVGDNTDLNVIIGNSNWFGNGSRIIITTRDKQVLNCLEKDNTYEPNEMNPDQSLLLFSRIAFKMDQPSEQFLGLSERVVKTINGLPLALEVIGTYLFGKSESVWKETVERLERIANEKVVKKLRICYDGLSFEEKQMFLDIACFFIGMDKDLVCYIWQACGFSSEARIEDLRLKSLVKIGEKNELWMHNQLRDLGREIVRQENYMKPGERSRLWFHTEALEVLYTKKGTEQVIGFYIDMLYENSQCVMTEGFANLTQLRLLQINNAVVTGEFKPSFSELRWLSLRFCSIQFTPTNPMKLAVLDLSYTDLTECWMGWNHIKVAKSLKVVNLSWCNGLSKTPDFSANLLLEELHFQGCENLAKIDPSIGLLKRLVMLNLYGCWRLKYLPARTYQLSSLKTLDIRYTGINQLLLPKKKKRIHRLPETFIHLEALTELLIDHSEVSRLANSICNLRNLKILSAESCKIQQGGIPHEIGRLSSLEDLRLGGNKFQTLPATISSLSKLQILSIKSCRELQSLPELPSSLKYLYASKCKITSLPALSQLTNLEVLCLDACKNLVEIPTPITALTRLESLSIRRCRRLQCIPQLPSGLRSLMAYKCGNLREISGFSDMKKLAALCLNSCSSLERIESLDGLDSLQTFNINYCWSLKKLPKLQHSKLLSYLEFCNVSLAEIEGLEGLYSLKKLIIRSCRHLKKIPDLSDLRNVAYLEIQFCKELAEIQGLERCVNLAELYITNCPLLKKIRPPEKLTVLRIYNCEKLVYILGDVWFQSLEVFCIEKCTSIVILSSHVTNSENLKILSAIDCKKLIGIRGADAFECLEKLNIHGCNSIKSLPCLSNLKNLSILSATECKFLTEIEGLDGLESLVELNLTGCVSLKRLPCLSNLKKLRILSAIRCKKFNGIQGADGLECLENLNISWCNSIESLPSLSTLKKLKFLSAMHCQKLTEIQGVDRLESLVELNINGCISLETLPCLSKLKKLQVLSAEFCERLTGIQGLDRLECLEKLNICGCISIETLPSLFKLKELKYLLAVRCTKLTKIQGAYGLKSLEVLNVQGCISMELPDLSHLGKLRTLVLPDSNESSCSWCERGLP